MGFQFFPVLHLARKAGVRIVSEAKLCLIFMNISLRINQNVPGDWANVKISTKKYPR